MGEASQVGEAEVLDPGFLQSISIYSFQLFEARQRGWTIFFGPRSSKYGSDIMYVFNSLGLQPIRHGCLKWAMPAYRLYCLAQLIRLGPLIVNELPPLRLGRPPRPFGQYERLARGWGLLDCEVSGLSIELEWQILPITTTPRFFVSMTNVRGTSICLSINLPPSLHFL